ncbi:hypothetical protein GCM10009114_20830 [Aliiglaciecola litoralis]|uniref:Uncharacterized protein n=1 Tax=Aliiglaciecola litoralis TaxID=582857 RepID=A0ABP3WV22_9ALTE
MGNQNAIMTHVVMKSNKATNEMLYDVSTHYSNSLMRKAVNLIHFLRGRCHNTDFKAADNILQEFQPEIIHCHFGTAAYFLYYIQQVCKNETPVVLSMHGFDVFVESEAFYPYEKIIKKHAQNNRLIVTVPSKFLKKHAVSRFGFDEESVRVVHNGFDSTLFYESYLPFCAGQTFKIIHVGRFIDLKGQKYLIEAISELKKRGITCVEAVFIGEGETLSHCKWLAKSLNVEESCHFKGAVNHVDIFKFVSQSHLYVHTSITASNGHAETFGVAVLEAVASGKPVVYFGSGGTPEIFEDSSGIFYKQVQEKSLDDLVEALGYFVEYYPSLDFAALQNARDMIVERFNDIRCAKQLQSIYSELLGRAPNIEGRSQQPTQQ